MFRIILENVGGKLDEEEARNEDKLKPALQRLVDRCEFRDGDVIRIFEANRLADED